MSTSPAPKEEQPNEQPRDAAYWSRQITGLTLTNVPSGALNLNVEGKMVNGPLQGFGRMWQKTYRMVLKHAPVSAKEIIKNWKERFPEFWPKRNLFFGPLTFIAPGEVALLNLTLTGGIKLSTGVLVLYADEESFTLMTPQGHVFAGWITFSALEEKENGTITVQAQVLMRSSDPMYEIGFRLGMYRQEDRFWQHTLKSLAASFGQDVPVEMDVILVDPRVQWAYAKNVWHNAAMRTTIYRVSAPLRWITGRGRKHNQK
jgi:hypothetical protein